MALQKTLFVVLLAVAFAYGTPIPLEDLSGPVVRGRELSRAPAASEYDYTDENPPKMYLILLRDSLNAPEDPLSEESANPSSLDLQKRDIENRQADDLETAAGTNVLRPLFVYRQQIAYRQRVRNERRRRYRF